MSDPLAPGLLSRLPQPACKVAIVRASRIGDFLCATPAFRALRAALPEAELTLIALPLMRDLALRSPHLDRFEPFPGFPGIAEQFFDARNTMRFIQQMQNEAFDLAIQLHGSGVYANPFTLLLGARATAGFVRAHDAPGRLDAAFPLPSGMHEVHGLLAFTTFLGAPSRGPEMEFPLWEDDERRADAMLTGVTEPLIGIQPGARSGNKRWAPERFVEVARTLRQRHGGTIIVLGGPDERALAEELTHVVGAPCLALAGSIPIPVMGAVIARLALLVTNDSGPAHIAYALGTPTITIFGGTEPARWGPLSRERHRVLRAEVPCRPCEFDECPIGARCLNAVSARDAAEVGMAMMRAGR